MSQLQIIDFSVPNPSQTANYSLPLYQGAGYRADFSTWALLQVGGFMKFNLDVNVPSDEGVILTFELSSSTIDGKSDCPTTISVNGTEIVKNYDPHIASFYWASWYVSPDIIKQGDNEVIISLTGGNTQVFIKAAGQLTVSAP